MATQFYLIWSGFIFSVCAIAFLGLDMSFNVYAVAIKQTFNFTQTEVELVSGSGMVGVGMSVIEPILFTSVGYTNGCIVIWLITTGSVFLMWVAVVYNNVINHWLIVCIIQYLMCTGEVCGTIRLVATMRNIFPDRHAAKIVGLGFGTLAIAKLLHGVLLEVLLSDVSIFFLISAIGQTVFLALSFFIYGIHSARLQVETEEECTSLKEKSEGGVSDGKKYSLSMVLASSYFHGIFWPSVITYSINFTLMNNITSIAKSHRMGNGMNLVYVLSITLAIARVLTGIVFDKFDRSVMCGFICLLTASLATILGLVILVLPLATETLYLASFLLGIAMSLGYLVPCLRLSEVFGRQYLPHIIGVFLCLNAFFCLLFQFFTGTLYDRVLSPDGFCYGPPCFFISCVIFLTFVIVLLCVHVANFLFHVGKTSLELNS